MACLLTYTALLREYTPPLKSFGLGRFMSLKKNFMLGLHLFAENSNMRNVFFYFFLFKLNFQHRYTVWDIVVSVSLTWCSRHFLLLSMLKQLFCLLFRFFFWILWWIESSEEPHVFEILIFCNIVINVLTITFDKFNAFFLNKSIFLEKKTFKIYIKLRSAYICMHPNEGVLGGGGGGGVLL